MRSSCAVTMAPNDRRKSLVDAREVDAGWGDPRREKSDLEALHERFDQMVNAIEPMKRYIDQQRAMELYKRTSTPPSGMHKVEPETTPPVSSLGPRAGAAERMLKLAGNRAWIVLLVIGSIAAVGTWSKEIAYVLGAVDSQQAKEDHALILKQAAELETLRQEIAALRKSDVAIVGHMGRLQNDTSQVMSKLGVEWKMSGPDAPTPTLVEFETPNRKPGTIGKGPLFIVKTSMPVPPKVPEAKP